MNRQKSLNYQKSSHSNIILDPTDNQRLANLCGPMNKHLRDIETHIGVEINSRGNAFNIIGSQSSIKITTQLIKDLYDMTKDDVLTSENIDLIMNKTISHDDLNTKNYVLKMARKTLTAKNKNQQHYINNMQNYDVCFGIGPAGTGKTYLAVAQAVLELEQDHKRRLILVRPAVEADEHLGFLPGDLANKVNPYLQPLYDALYDLLGCDKVYKLIDSNIIEIVPLAFMRGRTLNDSCIILDEAQNTTIKQMKMFLTRIGHNSKAIITGDITQIDLAHGKMSGLNHVINVLRDTPEIKFTFFNNADVVRNSLITKVLSAYERYEQNNN